MANMIMYHIIQGYSLIQFNRQFAAGHLDHRILRHVIIFFEDVLIIPLPSTLDELKNE